MRTRAIVSLLFLSHSLVAASREPPPTVEDYLIRLQTSGPLAVVGYCSAEVPELRDELRHEYDKYVEKVALANRSLHERLGSALAEPAPPGAEQFLELGNQILRAVKQYPAENYCPWLIDSMRKVSAESLRLKIEEAYVRYETLSARKQAQPGQ